MSIAHPTERLLRRRDAADVLAVSQTAQILKFERAGLLHAVPVPGIRAIRYSADEVHGLARRWIESQKEQAGR